MNLPNFHDVLRYQMDNHSQRSLDRAVVENGFLVLSTATMIIKIKLNLYFPKDQVKHAEGKMFCADLLEDIYLNNGVELTPDGVLIPEIGTGTTRLAQYSGYKLKSKRYQTTDTYTGKDLGVYTFPHYEHFFEEKTPKAYPNVGINAHTLNLLSNCFKQSTEGKANEPLRIEMFETASNFNQDPETPFRITPCVEAEPGAEVAVFCPTPLAGFKEMEEMI